MVDGPYKVSPATDTVVQEQIVLGFTRKWLDMSRG
jgi:hypothetical protein